MDVGGNSNLPIMQNTARSGMITRRLVAAGLIGPPLFVAVFLIEGATRPGYSAWRNFVSQLATGDWGWIQVVNFLVYGLLVLGFAVGLRRALGSGRASIAAPVLLGVYGLALLVAGVFVTDPALGYPMGAPPIHTTHGLIHGLAGLAAFGLLAAACFVMAWRFAGDAASRSWALYSLFTGLLVVACFILSNVFSVLDMQGALPNAPTGFVQRIAIIGGWAWIAVLAVHLVRNEKTQEGSISSE